MDPPAAAAAPWRVLLVEDSRDDAELIEISLREAGLALECRQAWSMAMVQEALRDFAPQLVLSDLNLPGFSAAEALALVRGHDPDVPFVLVSGLPADALPDAASAGDAVLSKDALDDLPDLVRGLLAPR